MARRASSGPNLTAIIGIAAFVILAFFGMKFLLAGKKGKISDVSPLKVEDFYENGNSFRGNEYLIEGTVDQRWPRDNGQLISILVKDTDDPVGVEVPAEFNSLNIEREQKLSIKVKVREGGVPVATEIQRQ